MQQLTEKPLKAKMKEIGVVNQLPDTRNISVLHDSKYWCFLTPWLHETFSQNFGKRYVYLELGLSIAVHQTAKVLNLSL